MKRFAILGFACVLAGVVHADQNSAFQDAKTFAGSTTAGGFSGVTSGAAADKIPSYGSSPAETQFFQGGQGAVSGPGVTKMQNCANYTPGQNKIANQECEVVNFLAKNPNVRPQFNIGNNDPMILGAKNARDNAATVFQSLGISGGTGSSAQCTTRTETTPAQYTTETCTTLRSIEGQQCTIGRVVNIDSDSNFQCDQTISAYETVKCQKVLSATIVTTGLTVPIDGQSITTQAYYMRVAGIGPAIVFYDSGVQVMQVNLTGITAGSSIDFWNSGGYVLKGDGGDTLQVCWAQNESVCWGSIQLFGGKVIGRTIIPWDQVPTTLYVRDNTITTSWDAYYGLPGIKFIKETRIYNKVWDDQCTSFDARSQP